MNKSLLRHIRPLLDILLPRNAGRLIRAFTILLRGKNSDEESLQEGLDMFIEGLSLVLVKEGLSDREIAEEVSYILQIGTALIDYWLLLWDEFFSPAILLLLWLRTTLNSNSTIEPSRFIFEPPKGFVPLPDAEIGGCARNDSLIAPLVN